MQNNNREYVIASWKHVRCGALQFWGDLTDDNQPRSFGGYTENIDECEKYTLSELSRMRYKIIDTVDELDTIDIECFIVKLSLFNDSKTYKTKRVIYMP